MISLGLDLSLTGTGVVRMDEKGEFTSRLIKSKPVGPLPIDELKRLRGIVHMIEGFAPLREVDLVLIEGLAFSIRNTTSLVQLSALNYLVRNRLYKMDVDFVIVGPTTLKKFVSGKGNTKKDGMMLETYKRWGVSFSSNDLCDAHGMARLGQILKSKSRGDLPKFQEEVVNLLSVQLT